MFAQLPLVQTYPSKKRRDDQKPLCLGKRKKNKLDMGGKRKSAKALYPPHKGT